MVEPYKPLYTIKEAAKVLGVNDGTLRTFINNKEIPALKIGSMRVRGSDLERFIETRQAIESRSKLYKYKESPLRERRAGGLANV